VEGIEEKEKCEVEYVYLHGMDLAPCQGCGGCEKTAMCVIKDDMIELYDKVDEVDILLIVSPVYFYGVTAQAKIFIDRTQARWSRKYLLKEKFRQGENRKGYFISIAATSGKKVFDGGILAAKCCFDALAFDYGGELIVRGVDGRGAIKEHSDELLRAQAFGHEIAHAQE
jgi:multimeric flavodoxin WrbA